jgi:hypothetical protein
MAYNEMLSLKDVSEQRRVLIQYATLKVSHTDHEYNELECCLCRSQVVLSSTGRIIIYCGT